VLRRIHSGGTSVAAELSPPVVRLDMVQNGQPIAVSVNRETKEKSKINYKI